MAFFMSEARKVLYVCTGNICRSAMAEHLSRHWAARRGLPLEFGSCGVAAEPYYQVPDIARKLLADRGVPAFEHKPRLATREVLRWADVIVAMADEHRQVLIERFPEFAGRVVLLREAAGFGEEDVADPMGLPDEEFTACLAVLEESLEPLFRKGFAA